MEHRLPEFHDCPGLQRGRGVINIGADRSYRPADTPYRRPRRRPSLADLFRFSDLEVRHLAIGLLLIAAIPLTWMSSDLFRRPIIILGVMGIFSAAFLLHELAHKFSAQRLGYWAEFRLNMIGLLITLMSFLPFTSLKIIAPGAVVISGLMFGEDYGKISLAGPLTNIIQALLYLFVGFTSANNLIVFLADAGVTVNSSLALFNLIPFGEFDGAKILRWDWRVWLAAVAASGLLFLYYI